MLNYVRSWAGPAMAGALAAGFLVGCGSAQSARPASPARPYRLYTHCGISEARIGNRYYLAVHPLSDGNGNPPPGWGSPYQPGTMTIVSPSTAVFRDPAGHYVLFRLRPGATGFRQVCS
jgi:hypothetical protein